MKPNNKNQTTTPLLVTVMLGNFLFGSITLAANGQDRGGGDAKECGGLSLSLSFEKTVHLADVVQAYDPTQFEPSYFDFMKQEELRNYVFDFIEKTNVDEAARVKDAYSHLKFLPTEQDLIELNTGIRYSILEKLLLGCKKKQLAIQEFKNNTVTVYEPNLKRLSVLELVLLDIHESYMRIKSAESDDLIEMEDFARGKVLDLYREIVKNQEFFLSARFGLAIPYAGSGYYTPNFDRPARTILLKCAGTQEPRTQRELDRLYSTTVRDLNPISNLCVQEELKNSGFSFCPVRYLDELNELNFGNAIELINKCINPNAKPVLDVEKMIDIIWRAANKETNFSKKLVELTEGSNKQEKVQSFFSNLNKVLEAKHVGCRISYDSKDRSLSHANLEDVLEFMENQNSCDFSSASPVIIQFHKGHGTCVYREDTQRMTCINPYQ